MSSESRPGNPSANLCSKHGEFLGFRCPCCEGVDHGPNTFKPSKHAYRNDIETGLRGDYGDLDPWSA